MRNSWARQAALAAAATWLAVSPVRAEKLLAPHVHALGVDPTTVAAFELLLGQALERQAGERFVRPVGEPVAGRPCRDAPCAARRARRAGVDAALLCTLTRLGGEHVVTLARVERSGRIAWNHQLTAARPEDLDDLAARLAAAVEGGRPAPGSESQDGVRAPDGQPSRLARSTQGPRVGTLYPLARAYAGVPRLTTIAYVWRYQTPSFDVESVPALGFAWGGDIRRDGAKARDWTLLDVFVAWTPLGGDLAPYVGMGLGLHGVRLERADPGPRREQGAMALTLAAGAGLALFRTYDFQLCADLRYQRFLNDFAELDGSGAQGLALTVGIRHR